MHGSLHVMDVVVDHRKSDTDLEKRIHERERAGEKAVTHGDDGDDAESDCRVGDETIRFDARLQIHCVCCRVFSRVSIYSRRHVGPPLLPKFRPKPPSSPAERSVFAAFLSECCIFNEMRQENWAI